MDVIDLNRLTMIIFTETEGAYRLGLTQTNRYLVIPSLLSH